MVPQVGQQVQDYLGLKSGPLTTTPVDADHLEQLGEFVISVIGTQEISARFEQPLPTEI